MSKSEALHTGDGIPGLNPSDVGADIRDGTAADVRGTHAVLAGAGTIVSLATYEYAKYWIQCNIVQYKTLL